MSIFMISTLVFSVFGIYQAELEKKYDKVGYLDMVFLENPLITENDVKANSKFEIDFNALDNNVFFIVMTPSFLFVV